MNFTSEFNELSKKADEHTEELEELKKDVEASGKRAHELLLFVRDVYKKRDGFKKPARDDEEIDTTFLEKEIQEIDYRLANQ